MATIRNASGLDEVGSEKGEGDRHVDLAHATAFMRGDGFGIHRGIGEESVSQRRPTDDPHQQKRLTAYGRV